MQVKLNNGTTLDALSVNGQSAYFQGANRDTLEFQFAREAYSLDELDKLFSGGNTQRITLTDSEGQYVYDNYSLRVSLKLEPVTITPETADAPAVVENRSSVTMGQKTYMEMQVDALRDTVDTLVLSAL